MGDIAASVLGADFPKIAGLFGLFFILLGIVPGPIKLGPVSVPGRDGVGRWVSLLLGCTFATVPLAGAYFNSTIGLINIDQAQQSPGIIKSGSAGGLFFTPAYAADKYTITIGQRSVMDTTEIFGGVASSLYVGDIHLDSPNIIVFFRSGAASIEPGVDLSEAEIRNALPSGDILFLGAVKQGDVQSFSVDGNQYAVTVENVIWFLVGDDSLILSVESTA